MRDSIEKNLKRWLKNKVKITMSLITIFLITGSIGYGATPITGSVMATAGQQYNMSGDVWASINGKNDFIMLSKDEGSLIKIYDINKKLLLEGTNGGIFAAIDNGEIIVTNITELDLDIKNDDSFSKKEAILAKNNGNINIYDIENFTLSFNGVGEEIVGLRAKESGKISLNSNNILIDTQGYKRTSGIYNHSNGYIELKADDNIEIKSQSNDDTINSTASNGIYNSGNLNLRSDNITISATAKGENAIGIFTDGGGVTKISNGKNLIVKVNSEESGATGIESGAFPSNSGSSTIEVENIFIEAISKKEEQSSYNSATAISSNGGKNTFNSNSISLIANGSSASYGISGNSSGEILITVRDGIKIDSQSNLGMGHGIYSAYNSNVVLNSEKGIEIYTLGDFSSHGLYNYNSSKTTMTTKDKIKIDSLSNSGTSYGIYSYKSNADLNSKGSIEISSKGNTSYGIASWTNAILDVEADGNIIVKSTANEKNSYGVYIKDKANIKTEEDGVGIIQITSISDKGISYGVYSSLLDEGVIDSSNINISSEVQGENGKASYSLAAKEGSNLSLIFDNKTYLSSQSKGAESYGILAQAGSNTTIVGDTLEIFAKGKEININEEKNSEKSPNLVVSNLYDATQGIRLEDEATLNLEELKIMKVISNDIAITAKNSNFTFNGKSHFEGNDYLIAGYEKDNLLVRPVIQAVNNSEINLSGNTTVTSRTGEDGNIDDARINNVGIYAEGNSVINIDGSLSVVSGRDILKDRYNITTLPQLQELSSAQFKDLISNTDISLMATSNGQIYIDSNENVFLVGDIIAGKDDSTVFVKGGNGNLDSIIVIGEVLATNQGLVGLDMSNGGYFVGRADDYFIIDEFNNIKLRNDKFSEDITEGGIVALKLGNGAIWNVIGQSYITHLDFAEGGGVVDLTYEGNALRIKNLSGEGVFNLTLDSENKDTGNMLYVYNVVTNIIQAMSLIEDNSINSKNNILTQKINLTDSILELEAGEKLRFATLGDDAVGKVQFVANEIKERGINNVSFKVNSEAYDVDDKENIIYNGENPTTHKPGNDIVSSGAIALHDLTPPETEPEIEDLFEEKDKEFIATENWYLTRDAETLNDGGKTIIEMSKANYAGAVYMDNLNKRLGDMRFANGKEGFWVRLRHDRVGEDNEYRLYNYMTQLGYDKPYPMDEGKGTEYRGIALEITTGDMEYKNINGDADIDRQALWLYDTNMYNNGFYSDYVFRIGRMESEFGIYGRETGARVEGTYKNLFLGASAEYGYKIDLSEKTYFEPQVQLQYTYIDETDYSTNQDTKVKLDEIHSIIGRVGARLGHDFYNDKGRKKTTVYAKADINHEFLGEQSIEAKDSTGILNKKYKNDGTWYDIGIGVTKEVTPDFNVYMDIERQVGRTKDDQSWQVNLGFRYILGE